MSIQHLSICMAENQQTLTDRIKRAEERTVQLQIAIEAGANAQARRRALIRSVVGMIAGVLAGGAVVFFLLLWLIGAP